MLAKDENEKMSVHGLLVNGRPGKWRTPSISLSLSTNSPHHWWITNDNIELFPFVRSSSFFFFSLFFFFRFLESWRFAQTIKIHSTTSIYPSRLGGLESFSYKAHKTQTIGKKETKQKRRLWTSKIYVRHYLCQKQKEQKQKDRETETKTKKYSNIRWVDNYVNCFPFPFWISTSSSNVSCQPSHAIADWQRMYVCVCVCERHEKQ